MSKFGPYLLFVFLILIGIFVFVRFHLGDLVQEIISGQTAVRPDISGEGKRNPDPEVSAPLLNDNRTAVLEDVKLPLKTAGGYSVKLFAEVSGARDIEISDEGIVLVSSPGDGEVVALSVGEGKVRKKTILDNLNSPHGLAFWGGKLFVAEKDKLSRYGWDPVGISVSKEKELMRLPSSGHAAHTLVFDREGNLLVKVGSACNVCDEADERRATIIQLDRDGNNQKIIARGLRNAAFMTLEESRGEIWATENGRDHLGDDLPPDEINIIRANQNYGWPYCYGGNVHDDRFDTSGRVKCDTMTPALFDLPAHSAPLGLGFIDPERLLVALHGSWNRSTPIGYEVVLLKVSNGKVTKLESFLSGFLRGETALGRPVDVEIDDSDQIFISDDRAGAVYLMRKNR